jgi:hypothetical protein
MAELSRGGEAFVAAQRPALFETRSPGGGAVNGFAVDP